MDIKNIVNINLTNSAQIPLKWAKILLLDQILSFYDLAIDLDLDLDLVGK